MLLLFPHEKNKHGSSFSWRKRLTSDFVWPALGEMLYMKEQEVNLRGIRGTKNFPHSLFGIAVLSLLTFSQKTWISEEDMKLASRKLSGFNAFKCFMAPETENMSSREDFIIQSCFVEKRMSLLEYSCR
jgi:hypothetical protein